MFGNGELFHNNYSRILGVSCGFFGWWKDEGRFLGDYGVFLGSFLPVGEREGLGIRGEGLGTQ
jgi:hypothetical protein